jgi:hypothetical protein
MSGPASCHDGFRSPQETISVHPSRWSGVAAQWGNAAAVEALHGQRGLRALTTEVVSRLCFT